MRKDYYTPEQRREYMRAYNANKKDKPAEQKKKTCECGGRAHKRICGSWPCPRCRELEGIDWHSNQINEDLAITRNISPAWLLRQLAAWQEGLKTWIEERGNELVIHAHGEYHLVLQ